MFATGFLTHGFMKKLFILLFLFTSLLLLRAQTAGDPIYVNYHIFSSVKSDKSDTKTSIQSFMANAAFPVLKTAKGVNIFGNANFKMYNLHNTGDRKEFLPDKLYDAKLMLIASIRLADDWTLSLSPQLDVRSDFSNGINGHNLFPGFNVLVVKKSKKTENLKYGAGVSYNNDLNINAIIPLGYLNYQSEQIRIYAILPGFAHIMLNPDRKIEYGLSYTLAPAHFYFDSSHYSAERNYLRYSHITLAPSVSINLEKDFWLNAKTGWAIAREFQILDKDYHQTDLTKHNKLKSGFFASAGLSLRIAK